MHRKGTYGVFSFVTPPIRGTHITVTFDGTTTASPKSFIQRALFRLISRHAFDFSAIIVMRNETTTIVVFDLKVKFVAADTMETCWRGEIG